MSDPLELVVSTRNADKLVELRALLADLAFTVSSAAERGVPEVEETGETLADNALLKAAAAFELTGALSLADDTGLLVDALDGAPGVRSARYAGEDATYEDNRELLVDNMVDVPDHQRQAAFVCSIALLVPAERAVEVPDGVAWQRVERADVPAGAVLYAAEGRVAGEILREARGSAGFGYDPVFFYPPAGQTLAEMEADAKNRISHRGRALQALRSCLEAYFS